MIAGSTIAPDAAPTVHRKDKYVLRGLATMMVVVFHLKSQFHRVGSTGWWPGGLSSGVDIFFVISGFIMVMTTAGKQITPPMFWWHRCVRIVPLYWLVTVFMTAVLLVVAQALQTVAYDRWHLISSYLFIPTMHLKHGSMDPLATSGRTSNYEMIFYFIFRLFIIINGKFRSFFAILTIFFLVAISASFSFQSGTILGLYTSDIMIEFALGMVLDGIVIREHTHERVRRLVGWILLGGGVLLLVLPLLAPMNSRGRLPAGRLPLRYWRAPSLLRRKGKYGICRCFTHQAMPLTQSLSLRQWLRQRLVRHGGVSV